VRLWNLRFNSENTLMKPIPFNQAGLAFALLLAAGCRSDHGLKEAGATRDAMPRHVFPALGKIERLDPALDTLIPPDAIIEKLAEGFDWSEGPVWVKAGGHLLFSDVPRNVVLKWQEDNGVSEFLKPSGYTASAARRGESGSNGLTLDTRGRLVLCQHGDRRVARLEAGGRFTTLAEFYQLRRFNSPNDLVFKSNGDLYFTDPPYGLEGQNDSPKKELRFNGVYRVSPGGGVTLLTDKLTFPNGLAFSPDERTLYVAVSDPQRPVIMAFGVQPDGHLAQGRVFFDAGALAKEKDRKGLPDGLKVDQAGNLFATGPGGVLVISPRGKLLGILNTGEATANCAWGNDGSVLYLTADMYLCRVRTGTRGRMP
jgi:gluconolactonase